MKRATVLLVSLLLTTTLLAQASRSVAPDVGSARGREVIIIKGDFGLWPPAVRFGDVSALDAQRLDPVTVRVVTPPHPAGTVKIWLFDYDMWIDTGLTFTFKDGYPEEVYERVLLPVFLPPIDGAHGSLFATDFRIFNGAEEDSMYLRGLNTECIITCPEFASVGGRQEETEFITTGRLRNPGVFFYIPKDRRGDLVAQLRVYDISREATNFGTEIPVVRDDEFRFEPVTLLGVPTDPRFRNTLRVYAEDERSFMIRMEGRDGFVREESVHATADPDVFAPAYAQLTNFPTNVGPLRVTITRLEPITSPPAPPVRYWAFNSVTNNETQHVTVISPQR